MTYDVAIEGKNYRLELNQSEDRWTCRLDGRAIEIDAVLPRRDVLSVIIDGKAYEIKRERTATDMHLWAGSVRYAAEVRIQILAQPRPRRRWKGSKKTDCADAG
jgi:hypothetical protein